MMFSCNNLISKMAISLAGILTGQVQKRLLPPAKKLGQGYIFTGVCHSVNRGGVLSQHALQVVSQHALQQVSGGSAHRGRGVPALGGLLLGGLLPGGGCLLLGGCLLPGGLLWGGLLWGGWPSVMAFCCGLLLCPSVMAFWFHGLLIEGGLLVWSSGDAEGHNRRPPHQKTTTPEDHHTRRP